MNNILMQQFIQLISSHTGLFIREQDREDLRKKISARIKILNFSDAQQYYQLLTTQNLALDPTLKESEWKELTRLLTTGETYFFRDRGQLNLLKNEILPEIIDCKKKLKQIKAGEKLSLRVWSAGCSTGEEVYSLAILIKELIPDWQQWDILILGTDINSTSIDKAKRGVYDSWSFRMVDPQLQKRYFSECKTSWKIDEQIHKMVTFQAGNLLTDNFPSLISNIHSMDIILCRNVFIYFDSQTISTVLEKFYATLKPGAYLIAGHTELYGQNLGQLQPKVFSESIVYQRSEDLAVKLPLTANKSPILEPSSKKPLSAKINSTKVKAVFEQTLHLHNSTHKKDIVNHLPSQRSPLKTIESTKIQHQNNSFNKLKNSVVKTSSSLPSALSKDDLAQVPPHSILSQAETLFHNGAYTKVIKAAEQVIKLHSEHNFGAYYLIAQAFANLGESEKAISYCQQALKIDPVSIQPYYLLAHIAEDKGDIEKAKELLKKIIYLEPSSIAAYLELGSLYEKEGDSARARKMRTTAFEHINDLPHHVTIEYQGKVTAGELMLHVKNMIKDL